MDRLTGERRGLAATVLAFYGFIYFLLAMSGQMPDWTPAWGAMALLYGLGFFSLVAGYFWARWYAIGLGLSGLVTAVFGLFQIGVDETLLFYGGTHGLVALFLWGKAMSKNFDGRADWRARFHLDEAGSAKLGRAVVRATVSLPYIVLYALAPKEGMGAAGFLALLLGGAGLYGLIRLRTWGVVAMAGAAGMLISSLALEPAVAAQSTQIPSVEFAALVGITAAIAAVIPFAGPLVKFLKTDIE